MTATPHNNAWYQLSSSCRTETSKDQRFLSGQGNRPAVCQSAAKGSVGFQWLAFVMVIDDVCRGATWIPMFYPFESHS